MARQGSQFTAVGRLVESKEDDSEASVVPEPVQQRAKRTHIVGWPWDVCATVPAEHTMNKRIMVSPRTRVDLHHQPVLEAHRGHFCQDLAPEKYLLRGCPGARPAPP